MPVPLRALAPLLLSACAVLDPDAAAPLAPTLVLSCRHPDMWFEGVYPGPEGSRAYPADAPYRPGTLQTELARADWHGAGGANAQTACADVCVGLAESSFYYRCPDTGWAIDAELTLAPARVALAGLDPDACFPGSACAAAFAAPIGVHLRSPAGVIPAGRGQADHLGVLVGAALELQLPGATVAHPLHGSAEYSAGACEAAPCPFYLADLQLDDHGARSRADLDLGRHVAASLHGLQVELMQPALGAWTPATGELEFPVGALDLRIRLAVAAGRAVPAGEHELRLRNPIAVRGRFTAGALELAVEVPLAAAGSARMALEFRPRASPPIADFDPPTRQTAGRDGLALPQDPALASPLHGAHDPDDDLRAIHWVVDGVPGAKSVPPGEHEVELWAVDARGALARSPQRTIHVVAAL